MSALTDLADRAEKAFNRADPDAWVDCFADDAVQHHPFFPAPNQGKEAIRAAESAMFSGFSDIEMTVVRTVEQGDEWGALELVCSATNTDDLQTPNGPVPATNKRITVPMGSLVRLDADGRIAEERRYYDVVGMMAQLGLLPE